jgi:pimeloyl-ACP methyl ester carboxylesterase
MHLKETLILTTLRLKFKTLSLLSPRLAAEKAFTLFCTPPVNSRLRRPSIFHTNSDIRLTLDEYNIAGYRWGNAGDRKILILHGFGSAAYKFHRYVHPLLQQGYQVYAFDAPAHGKSDGKTVNVLEYSRMIEAAHQKFGPFSSFIAHSFGGLALMLAMEKIPGDADRKVVLIAPATETASSAEIFFQRLGIRSEKVKKHFHELIYLRSGRKTEWFSVNRSIRKNSANILWVHDEDDDVTPIVDTRPTREANLPHVEFHITDGLGHKAIYHDKAVRERILEFLL